MRLQLSSTLAAIFATSAAAIGTPPATEEKPAPAKESETPRPARTDNGRIDTPLEAMEFLLPLQVALNKAEAEYKSAPAHQKENAKTKLQDASDAMIRAQEKLNTLFGEGAEANITFTHMGRTYTAPVDCDHGFLMLSKTGFQMEVTAGLMEGVHEAVMKSRTDLDMVAEKKVKPVGSSLYIPLSHEATKAYRAHAFAPDSSKGEKWKSTHNIDQAVIKQVIEEVVRPRLLKLNTELKAALEEEQKKQTAPASGPAPAK